MLLSGATAGWVFAAVHEWTGWLIAALEALALIGLFVILTIKRPEILARWLCWLPAHLFYRIEVTGRENVPRKGGVLFVCNHVSYIDALLVFMAQRRLIRFMIWRRSRTPLCFGSLSSFRARFLSMGPQGPELSCNRCVRPALLWPMARPFASLPKAGLPGPVSCCLSTVAWSRF